MYQVQRPVIERCALCGGTTLRSLSGTVYCCRDAEVAAYRDIMHGAIQRIEVALGDRAIKPETVVELARVRDSLAATRARQFKKRNRVKKEKAQ